MGFWKKTSGFLSRFVPKKPSAETKVLEAK
jgi:hypothetical protein